MVFLSNCVYIIVNAEIKAFIRLSINRIGEVKGA